MSIILPHYSYRPNVLLLHKVVDRIHAMHSGFLSDSSSRFAWIAYFISTFICISDLPYFVLIDMLLEQFENGENCNVTKAKFLLALALRRDSL